MPFGRIATCYGLLQLPKMPEIQKFGSDGFTPMPDLDLNIIPYKDKQREEIRQNKLQIYNNTGKWPGKKQNVRVKKQTEAWSKTKEVKDEKKQKKLKRKLANEKRQEKGEPVKKKKKKNKITAEEIAELAKDVMLCKKLKNKKITDEEFENEIGMSD